MYNKDDVLLLGQREKRVFDKLLDQESQSLFLSMHKAYMEKRTYQNYEMVEISIHYGTKKWREKGINCFFLDEPRKAVFMKPLLLFGAGRQAGYFYRLARHRGYDVLGFVDNKAKGLAMGQKILPPQVLKEKYKHASVLVSSTLYQDEIIDQLLDMGIEPNRIYFHYNNIDRGYFTKEFFAPQEDEVYIDAGTLDCLNIRQFVEFTSCKYKKIYAFEADPIRQQAIEKELKQYIAKDIVLIKKGVYSSSNSVYAMGAGDMMRIVTEARADAQEIKVTSIDEVLDGERVSFIKMDIEGAELEALKGAKNSISRHKPRMAICIYHKPEDYIEIAEYIAQLNPDYRFWIRHNSFVAYETVLYVAQVG